MRARWQHRFGRLADERGQDAIEYTGVLAVVATVIAIVILALTSVAPALGHDVVCLVEKIFGNGCTTGKPYPVSVSVQNAGYDARVAVVDGAHGYTVTLTKYSDGTSTITAVNNGKLGASLQWGGDFELGPVASATADASLGGGGYGQQTVTWKFSSWGQGQRYYQQLSSGNGASLAVHDAGSATVGQTPVIGNDLSGAWDWLFGGQSAPSTGSVPHRYLNSTAVGGGLQGSAEAKAAVNAAGFSAGVGGSADGNIGVQRFTYGSQKGDWQVVAGLDASGGANLGAALFGPQASAVGTINRELAVTLSPDGKPLEVEVAASGDGVWGVVPAGPNLGGVRIPTSGGPSGAGESGTGGSEPGAKPAGGEGGGAAGSAPALSFDSTTTSGSGTGSSFVGTLDLQDDPQAAADVQAVLHGDTSKISAVIHDMNTSGTETVQSYGITRSNDSVGAQWSDGVGLGGHINDSGSTATYNPPKTRVGGGPWQTGSQ